MLERGGATATLILSLVAVASSIFAARPAAANLSSGRDRLPVVLEGSSLGPWVGTERIDHIYLYRYESTTSPRWIPIPFQIDKRRKVNFIHFVGTRQQVEGNPNSPDSNVCVLSYFPPDSGTCATWQDTDPVNNPLDPKRECPVTYELPFSSDFLAGTDEIEFMARDLVGGERDICPYDWPGADPTLQNQRIEIMLTDDADDNGVIADNEKYWVYAYLWNALPPVDQRSTKAAPTFTPETCAPQPPAGQTDCLGAAFNVHCGTVTGPSNPSLEGIEIHTSSNWVVDDLRVTPPGSPTPGSDILQIFGYRANDIEDNRNWDCNGFPRDLGVTEPGLR